MICSVRKFVALLLLVVLTTNVCVWDSSRARMAHQIIHISQVDQGAGNHAHPSLATAESIGKASVLHQVLHAVDHLQFFADAGFHADLQLPAASLGLVAFAERTHALTALDPPYRPPSVQASLA